MDETGLFRLKHIKDTDAIRTPGLSKRQLLKKYSDWQTSEISYDEVQQERGYNGPRKTADVMAQMVPEAERSGYRILDVGAGTGIVGKELFARGFKLIDGLDPSPVLLKAAIEKCVYSRLYNCFMTENKTIGIEDGYYNGLTTCGCFMENHIPVKVLDEMLRVVKPGGVLVITTRYRYLDDVEMYRDNKLEIYMKELEEQGKWTQRSREIFTKYYDVDDGIVWTYVRT